VTQINLLLDTVLASFLTTGSISWLYYSDRLMEFPLGVLGVALATVLLPKLSQQRAQDDPQGFTRSLDWGLRMVLLFGLPAALGLALLAGPMIATLFMSDVFTAHDVQMARLSLMAYSSGLLAFIFIKVLAPAYYAQQDTRTPVKIGVIAMLANMALNLALIYPLQHAGLALATSLSAYLNAFLLWRGLRQRGLYMALPGWMHLLVQVALASLAMGALLLYAPPVLDDWLGQTVWFRVGQLLLWVTLAAVVYFAVLRGSGLKFADLKIKKVES
jgi:putative peptidoglycan lipid II flippase